MKALAALPPIVALLLALATTLRESCTVDEFGNLPLTVVYWHGGALHIDPGNPPLTRWIQGIPLLGREIDPGATISELAAIETSWDLGYRFESAHVRDYHDLLVRARFASVVLLMLTALGVFVWTRDIAGTGSALGAGLLAATSPNLLAHGRLVTPDIGIAALVLWASWASSRALRSNALGWLALTGALTALAVLAKFSGLLLLPIFAILFLSERGRPFGSRIARKVLFGTVLLVVLFAGWGFPEFGRWEGLPTPFPDPLVQGVRAQLVEDPYPAYLLGENRAGGWPWYYAVALATKVPIPTLLLVGLGVWVTGRERRRELWLPLVVAGAFFVVFGFGTKKNVGVRYLLPMFPLLFIVGGAALSATSSRIRLLARALVTLAIVTGVIASRAPLAYFNGAEKLVGGKRATLVDSNLDWGQALPDLKNWMAREGIETIPLAYFGRIDPSTYGISWRTLPPRPVAGPAAISATLAVGRPYFVLFKERASADPQLAYSDGNTWRWTKGRLPDAELGGGAILVWKDVAAAAVE